MYTGYRINNFIMYSISIYAGNKSLSTELQTHLCESCLDFHIFFQWMIQKLPSTNTGRTIAGIAFSYFTVVSSTLSINNAASIQTNECSLWEFIKVELNRKCKEISRYYCPISLISFCCSIVYTFHITST